MKKEDFRRKLTSQNDMIIKLLMGLNKKTIDQNSKDEIPSGAKSFDSRRLCTFAKGTIIPEEILSYTTKQGEYLHITGYATFTDAEIELDVEFFPQVEKQRVFKFHGNSSDNFRMSLGLGPDLSDNMIIRTELVVPPRKTFRCMVVNRNLALDIPIGFRFKGFIDQTNRFGTVEFGG